MSATFFDFLIAPLPKIFVITLPEIYLFLTIIFIGASEVTYHKEKRRLILPIVLLGLMAGIAHMVWSLFFIENTVFVSRNLVFSRFTVFFKLLVFVGATLQVFYGLLLNKKKAHHSSEFYVFLLSFVLAACGIIQSDNFVLTSICFVLFSLTSWFLVLSNGGSVLSEYSSRVNILSTIFSIVFFFVFVLIFYSAFGVLSLEEAKALVDTGITLNSSVLLYLYILFIFSLSSYLYLFPMNLFLTDVMKGASFLSVPILVFIGPLCVFSFCVRVSATFFLPLFFQGGVLGEPGEASWRSLTLVLAFIGMLYSSIMSFRRKDLKKITAYFVVYQLSFFYLSFSILTEKAISSAIVGMVSVLISTIGVLYFSERIYQKGYSKENYHWLRGLVHKEKKNVFFLILFFTILLGLPVFPGFVSKFIILTELIHLKYYGVIFSIVLFEVIIISSFARLIGVLTQGCVENNIRNEVVLENKSFMELAFIVLLVSPCVLVLVYLSGALGWLGESFRVLLWS